MKTECWLVIAKRKDGNLPAPVKNMYAEGRQALHFSYSEAVTAMYAINSELGGDFAGVFRCLIKVVEDKTP